MISTRAAFLLRFWEQKCCPPPTTPLRSAIAGGLLNCLSLEEIVQLILADTAIDQRLREKVLTRLTDKAVNVPSWADSVVQKLLDSLASIPHPRQATAAYFLERLYDSVPSTRRQAIVHAFIRSPQPMMRKRAYRLLHRDWSPVWKSEVQRSWEEWHESECAFVIIDRFDSAFLVQHIEQLAVDLNDGAHVARLFLRACAVDASLLTKLRRLDGITYAYVSACLGKGIPKRVARQLWCKYKHNTRLGILAWCLGMLGHWDLLVELSEGVGTLEDEIHRRDLKLRGIPD